MTLPRVVLQASSISCLWGTSDPRCRLGSRSSGHSCPARAFQTRFGRCHSWLIYCMLRFDPWHTEFVPSMGCLIHKPCNNTTGSSTPPPRGSCHRGRCAPLLLSSSRCRACTEPRHPPSSPPPRQQQKLRRPPASPAADRSA